MHAPIRCIQVRKVIIRQSFGVRVPEIAFGPGLPGLVRIRHLLQPDQYLCIFGHRPDAPYRRMSVTQFSWSTCPQPRVCRPSLKTGPRGRQSSHERKSRTASYNSVSRREICVSINLSRREMGCVREFGFALRTILNLASCISQQIRRTTCDS